jgi:hypothetical protein
MGSMANTLTTSNLSYMYDSNYENTVLNFQCSVFSGNTYAQNLQCIVGLSFVLGS